MSTRNPGHGTKVKDPSAPEIQEGAGFVASDSLAAESHRSGGGFSLNRNSEPLGVSGSSSTFANTNVSGAKRLEPASDAEARMAKEDWAREKNAGGDSISYPSAADGQSKSLAGEDTRDRDNSDSVSHAHPAPTYVLNQYIKEPGGPKGKNLREGVFEDNDGKNASFNNEIRTENDPGRIVEAKYERANAETAEAMGVPVDRGAPGKSEYDVLSSDTSA